MLYHTGWVDLPVLGQDKAILPIITLDPKLSRHVVLCAEFRWRFGATACGHPRLVGIAKNSALVEEAENSRLLLGDAGLPRAISS